MRPTSLIVAVGAFLSVVAASVPDVALAEKTYMRPRFGLRGAVGVGGEALFDGVIDYGDDLQATAGVAVEIESPITRGYSIGVEAGAHAWRTDLQDDRAIDRNVLVDVLANNRFRLAWGDRGSHGAFYLAAPIGVTVSIARDDYGTAIGDDVGTGPIDLGPGGGLHVGGRAGIQVFFGKVFGLTVEGGYEWRLLRHRVTTLLGGEDHAQIRFGQGTLQAGVVFAF